MADETKPNAPVTSPAGGVPTPTPGNVKPPGDEKVQALKDATTAENTRLRAKSEELANTPTKFTLPSFVDIAALQDIYGAMRDGDYWSAFKRSVAFLHQFLNTPKTQGVRATPARPMSEAEYSELDRTIGLLEKQIDNAELRTGSGDARIAPSPRFNRPENVAVQNTNIGFMEVMGIVRLVLEMVQQFRKNRLRKNRQG